MVEKEEEMKNNEFVILPDGSGFATMSIPFPKDHWLTKDGENIPPMPFKMGTKDDSK